MARLLTIVIIVAVVASVCAVPGLPERRKARQTYTSTASHGAVSVGQVSGGTFGPRSFNSQRDEGNKETNSNGGNQGANSNGGNQGTNPNGRNQGANSTGGKNGTNSISSNADHGSISIGQVANGNFTSSFNSQGSGNYRDKYETNSDYNNYGSNSYYGNKGTISNGGNHETNTNSGRYGRSAGPNDDRQDLTAAHENITTLMEKVSAFLEALKAARRAATSQNVTTVTAATENYPPNDTI